MEAQTGQLDIFGFFCLIMTINYRLSDTSLKTPCRNKVIFLLHLQLIAVERKHTLPILLQIPQISIQAVGYETKLFLFVTPIWEINFV